jgi:hypothetical protein
MLKNPQKQYPSYSGFVGWMNRNGYGKFINPKDQPEEQGKVSYADFIALITADDWDDVLEIATPIVKKYGPKLVGGLWNMLKKALPFGGGEEGVQIDDHPTYQITPWSS